MLENCYDLNQIDVCDHVLLLKFQYQALMIFMSNIIKTVAQCSAKDGRLHQVGENY